MLNRRELLTGASLGALALALTRNSEAALDEAKPTGKVNLELTGLDDYNLSYPFINIIKTGTAGIWFGPNDVEQFTTTKRSGQPGSAYGIYCDDYGECLVPLPAGCNGFNRIFYEHNGPTPTPVAGGSNYPTRVGERMITDWDGGLGWTVTMGGAAPVQTGTKPFYWNWQSDSANLIYLFRVGRGRLSDPPRNIRIYKASHQALYKAGEIFDPNFIEEVSAGAGIIRMMDMQETNNNDTTYSIDRLFKETGPSFTVTGFGGNAIQGLPLSVIANLAIKTNKCPWINIPHAMTAGKTARGCSISNAARPTVTTLGPHAYVDGDKVLFCYIQSRTQTLVPTYAGSVFASPAHGLRNGQGIQFGLDAEGQLDASTYPSEIKKGTMYYVVNRTENTFQISATISGRAPGTPGAALSLSGSMIGQCNVFFGGFAKVIRPSYDGVSTWTFADHGMLNGECILFGLDINYNTDGTTYPSGLKKNSPYYVVNATANTFQIALSEGGAAIRSHRGSVSGGPANVYRGLSNNIYTVINSNPAKQTFDLDRLDTSTWSSATDNVGSIAMPYSIATIATEVGRLAAYFKENLPATLVPIFQYSNENWNLGFTQYGYAAAQSRQLHNQDLYQTYGFLSAACAKAVRDAYGGDHTKYKFVIECMTGYLGVFPRTIAGINKFRSENCPTLKVNDLYDYFACTTYWGGVIYAADGAATPAVFNASSSTFTSAYPGADYALKFATSGGRLPIDKATGQQLDSNWIYYALGPVSRPGNTPQQFSRTFQGTPVLLSGPITGPYTVFQCKTTIVKKLMDESEAKYGLGEANEGKDPNYPTKYTYFNQAIAEDCYDGRWASGWSDNTIKAGIAIAKKILSTYCKPNGVGLISYEGGDGNNPGPADAVPPFPLLNDSRWQEFYHNSQYSQGSYDNIMQMAKGFVAIGGEFPAQFAHVGPVKYGVYGYGNFGANEWLGQNSLRWQGVVAFNNS